MILIQSENKCITCPKGGKEGTSGVLLKGSEIQGWDQGLRDRLGGGYRRQRFTGPDEVIDQRISQTILRHSLACFTLSRPAISASPRLIYLYAVPSLVQPS